MPEATLKPELGNESKFVPSFEKSKNKVPVLSVLQLTTTPSAGATSAVPVYVAALDKGVVVVLLADGKLLNNTCCSLAVSVLSIAATMSPTAGNVWLFAIMSSRL